MYVVFKTPGLIPIESFTTFGINSKPSTSTAIGFFGTGLKYAVAVLCRLGIPVEVWIGEKCHHFYPSKQKFRGKEFEFISMKRRDGLVGKWFGHTRLPFTTELGKTWELWQAFRELHSNTLDELGVTFASDSTVVGVAGQTHIVIPGTEIAEVWAKRGEVFLEGGVQSLSNGDWVQVFHRASPYLYYRGLRVFTLQKPSRFTWNFLESLQLTEDRTLAAQYMPAYYAVRHVTRSTDKAFIRDVLTAEETEWEYSFDYSNIGAAPTEEFLEMARMYGRRSMVGSYLRTYDPVTRAAAAQVDWRTELVGVLSPTESFDAFVEWDEVLRVIKKHRVRLVDLLKQNLAEEHPAVVLPSLPIAGATALAAATDAALGDASDEPPLEAPEEPMARWATQEEIDAGLMDDEEDAGSAQGTLDDDIPY